MHRTDEDWGTTVLLLLLHMQMNTVPFLKSKAHEKPFTQPCIILKFLLATKSISSIELGLSRQAYDKLLHAEFLKHYYTLTHGTIKQSPIYCLNRNDVTRYNCRNIDQLIHICTEGPQMLVI